MSHIATNWAFQLRGLKPSAKIVLLVLADCHNPANGCFPTQAFLADACEMNRDTVNVQLAHLEERGLIQRVRSIDPATKRQRPTRYKLAFEADFSPDGEGPGKADIAEETVSEKPTLAAEPVSENPADPCRKSEGSRVGNSDTNHVREPLKEPCVGGGAAAHTPEGFEEFWEEHPRPRSREKCKGLFRDAVAAGVETRRILDAVKRYRAENAGNRTMYVAYADNWLVDRRWNDYPEIPAAQPHGDVVFKAAAFWAEKLKRGGYVPPSAISQETAACMVATGLVTPDMLLRAGVGG